MTTRRAMLLSLGVSLADAAKLTREDEPEVAEAELAPTHVLLVDGLTLRVEDWHIKTHRQMLDVTSFGDMQRQFVAGAIERIAKFTLIVSPSQAMQFHTGEFLMAFHAFSWEADTFTVKGRLRPVRVSNDLVTPEIYRVEAQLLDVAVTPIFAETSQPATPLLFRRAMRLGVVK